MMKFVKISQDDLNKVTDLYNSIMSTASSGLFMREGFILGEEIARESKFSGDYFDGAAELLLERGWVDEVTFEDDRVIVNGSAEAARRSSKPGCHRLKGIIRRLYELHSDRKMLCTEVQCQGSGADSCVFKVESLKI